MHRADLNVTFLVDAALGCEVVIASVQSVAYPRHTHVSTYVVGLIRAGRFNLERAGDSVTLGPGDSFVIPPHQAHSLRAAGVGQILNLCLNNAIFDQPGARQRAVSVAGALKSLVARGWLKHAEWATLRRILVAMAAEKAESGENRAVGDGIARLESDLERHPEQPSCLADMAAGAHLDRFHLIRKFRKRYGLAPRQFQNQNRLRKARRELLRPGCSLTEAALRAGFYDQSHFIRAFRRMYGLTPGQYIAARRDARFSTGPA